MLVILEFSELLKLKKISNIKNILLNKYHGINAHTKEKNQTNTNLIKFKIN